MQIAHADRINSRDLDEESYDGHGPIREEMDDYSDYQRRNYGKTEVYKQKSNRKTWDQEDDHTTKPIENHANDIHDHRSQMGQHEEFRNKKDNSDEDEHANLGKPKVIANTKVTSD